MSQSNTLAQTQFEYEPFEQEPEEDPATSDEDDEDDEIEEEIEEVDRENGTNGEDAREETPAEQMAREEMARLLGAVSRLSEIASHLQPILTDFAQMARPLPQKSAPPVGRQGDLKVTPLPDASTYSVQSRISKSGPDGFIAAGLEGDDPYINPDGSTSPRSRFDVSTDCAMHLLFTMLPVASLSERVTLTALLHELRSILAQSIELTRPVLTEARWFPSCADGLVIGQGVSSISELLMGEQLNGGKLFRACQSMGLATIRRLIAVDAAAQSPEWRLALERQATAVESRRQLKRARDAEADGERPRCDAVVVRTQMTPAERVQWHQQQAAAAGKEQEADDLAGLHATIEFLRKGNSDLILTNAQLARTNATLMAQKHEPQSTHVDEALCDLNIQLTDAMSELGDLESKIERRDARITGQASTIEKMNAKLLDSNQKIAVLEAENGELPDMKHKLTISYTQIGKLEEKLRLQTDAAVKEAACARELHNSQSQELMVSGAKIVQLERKIVELASAGSVIGAHLATDPLAVDASSQPIGVVPDTPSWWVLPSPCNQPADDL